MSLELVVVMIVILIVALVVIGIFTGGVQNFMSIFTGVSDDQIKLSMCVTACANYCMIHPDKDSVAWGSLGLEDPKYKGAAIGCQAKMGGNCVCKTGTASQTPASNTPAQHSSPNTLHT